MKRHWKREAKGIKIGKRGKKTRRLKEREGGERNERKENERRKTGVREQGN